MSTTRKTTSISLAISLALSIVLIAFLTYKDILNYFFSNMDLTYLVFYWRIESLHDVLRVFTEPWATGFYRPITTLSFSLDYAIWGLNPFGWQLTNLILHILVSVLVFFVIVSLTKGELLIAWLSAVIFTTHPVLANDVQVIPYRQDIVPAIFILLTVILFLKYMSAESKKYYLFLSLLFCFFALGSKEIAVITPVIIFSYVIIFSEKKSFKNKTLNAVKIALPFFLLAFLYVAWRAYLFRGFGGYGRYSNLPVWTNIKNYLAYLLDPVHLLHLGLTGAILIIFFGLLIYRQEIKSSFTGSIYGKSVVFLLIWMLLPLAILLYSLGYIDPRQAYMPAMPFSGVLSVVFVNNTKSTFQKLGRLNTSFIKSLIASLMTLCLIAYLFIYSPLIKNYREVENCGKICKIVLYKLLEIVPKMQADGTIYITNLPINVYPRGASPVLDGSCFEDGNYKKFIDYYYPGNRVKFVPQYTIWNIDTDYPLNVDSDMRLEIRENKDKNAVELDIKLLNKKITISY